ncbi:MAG TPA: WYL domain-containing protein [Acidimicrobiales bacterium]|nr:WYL domain-containing protein [Acidimicrobiales bacterium]
MWDTSARLLRLLSLLQAGREWPGRALADRLEVDVRTVRRDVDRLRRLGYPVHATPGAAGGYRLEAGADLPPLLLDDDEAVAIAVGLRTAAGGSVTGIEESSARALGKLERLLPARLRGRVAALSAATVAVGPRGPQVAADLLSALASATRDHQRLRFDYRRHDGAEARRTVEPLRLVHAGVTWYLVGWDADQGDWRTFRVDRIASRPVPVATFTPRPPPADDLAAWVAEGAAVRAYRHRGVFTLHAPAEEVAERLSPTAGVLEALDGRTCRLTTGAQTLGALAFHVVNTGVEFTVHEPPELVDHLVALAGRLLRAADVRPDPGGPLA